MHHSRRSSWKRAFSALLLGGFVAACSTDAVGPGNASPLFGVAEGDGAKQVYLCNWGEPGTSNTFKVTVSNDGGTLPLGSTLTLPTQPESEECPVIWQSTWPREGGLYDTRITVEEINIPTGVFIWRIVGQTYTNYVQYDNVQGVAPYVTSVSIDVNPDNPGRIWFKHIGAEVPPPPPPPVACDGLTPGYWKNWSNHYTAAQFETLIQGTIAGSITQANAILSYEGSEAIGKLRKFILANQLTLNLVANPGFPNPDGAFLNAGCTSYWNPTALGDAMQTALAMHANPRGYTKDAILAVKDILDHIANMND